MGKPAVTGIEQATNVVTASLGALNAATGPFNVLGQFNIWIGTAAFVGTVSLQASYDGGATWVNVINKYLGTPISFTGAAVLQEEEVEPGVLYQLICSAYTSGAAAARLSAGFDSGDSRRLT